MVSRTEQFREHYRGYVPDQANLTLEQVHALAYQFALDRVPLSFDARRAQEGDLVRLEDGTEHRIGCITTTRLDEPPTVFSMDSDRRFSLADISDLLRPNDQFFWASV